jgi:hypothetical protein
MYSRSASKPLIFDADRRVATALPCCHVLALPCRACGSPTAYGQVYCTGCLGVIGFLESGSRPTDTPNVRLARMCESLERFFAAAAA